MKTITQISRMMFAALSLMLLLAGCGGGGGSPAGFATDQVAGKTFAYTRALAAMGTLWLADQVRRN